MQFHKENKTWASCLCVQVAPDSNIVSASAELIFLLSSVGSAKTYMLQTEMGLGLRQSALWCEGKGEMWQFI